MFINGIAFMCRYVCKNIVTRICEHLKNGKRTNDNKINVQDKTHNKKEKKINRQDKDEKGLCACIHV